MNNTLLISTTLDHPALLENLVEKLAWRRYDLGYGAARVPENWLAVDTSTGETYVSGTLGINEQDEMVNMPFITRFLFTCVKEKNGSYKLEWSSSLS